MQDEATSAAQRSEWPGPGAVTRQLGADPASEAVVQAALTATGAAAWQTDLQTRERHWSPEMFAVHGLAGTQDAPDDYMELVHPEDRDTVAAAFRQSVETGLHRVEYRVVWPDGSVHWIEGAGRTRRDEQGRPSRIHGVCMLIDGRKRDEADLRFLATAATEFARSTDYEETLRRVAAMAVPHFADWCAVDMLDERGELRRLAVAHVDPAKVSLAEELHRRYPPDRNAPRGTWHVLKTGQPDLLPEITDELLVRGAHDAEHLAIVRSLGLRSYMGVPIVGPDGVLGVITFVSSDSGRIYGPRDVDLARDLVSRAAVAIRNAGLVRALRESEARWRGLFESMAEGFFVGEAIRDASGRMRDFRFKELNPAFERLTGVPVAAALNRPVTEAIPGVQPEVIDLYARVVDTGLPGEFEIMVPALNDRWYEARARRVGPDQFSVLFLEITERKAAQAQLARTAERYRTLFESIDEGFCILEVLFDAQDRPHDYRFLEVNPAFERQSGLRNATGRTIRELVPDIEHTYIETYGRVAKTGEPLRFESHTAALQRWFDAYAFRFGDPAQRRVALLFNDITERKQIEQALREADARKDEFLATLAHELRNPLAPLRSGLAILRRADMGSAASVRARELMERQLTHMVRLVDDLLDVSRVTQGKVAMKKSLEPLHAVVELALETSRPAIESAGHALSVDLPAEPLLLCVDATRMAQVLANVLNNAAKYTPHGGRIALRACRLGAGRLRIEVQDSGVGIPPDMVEKVFELFTQVGRTLDRSQGGLGIGLSLARRLVELHGGTIRAESPGEHRGTTFVIELPLPGSAAG